MGAIQGHKLLLETSLHGFRVGPGPENSCIDTGETR